MFDGFWSALANWAGTSQWRHMLIQAVVAGLILASANWLLSPWVPDLIHLFVCQFIGPC